MEDIGAYLRKLREEQGRDYQRIFEDTRVREEQIKLLEANEFLLLGPRGMVKALLFNYTRYLGGDVEAVMDAFSRFMPKSDSPLRLPSDNLKQKKIMLSTNFLWTVGIIIFVVILSLCLWYAYSHGWLKTPELFKRSAADTTVVAQPVREEVKPDSLRLKMLDISRSLEGGKSTPAKSKDSSAKAVQDSTDYLGQILGPSQVNVPIH